MTQELASLRVAKADSETELLKQAQKILQLEQREESLIQTCEIDKNTIENQSKEIDDLKKEIIRINKSHINIEETLQQKERDGENLHSYFEAQKLKFVQEIEDLKKQLELTYTDLQTANLEKEECENRLSINIKHSSEMEHENAVLHSEIEQMVGEHKQYENALSMNKEDYKKIESALMQTQNELKYANDKVLTLSQAKSKIESKYDNDITNYKDLLAAEEAQYNENLMNLKDKCQKYQELLSETKEVLGKSEAENLEQQRQNKDLNEQLMELNLKFKETQLKSEEKIREIQEDQKMELAKLKEDYENKEAFLLYYYNDYIERN
jgi:hypothetical protein